MQITDSRIQGKIGFIEEHEEVMICKRGELDKRGRGRDSNLGLQPQGRESEAEHESQVQSRALERESCCNSVHSNGLFVYSNDG